MCIASICNVEFQFPPPRGGERTAPGIPRFHPYFNSRPREGANSHRATVRMEYCNFNSRPREGANNCTPTSSRITRISIPAPARGRTGGGGGLTQGLYISIPAPARGRTRRISAVIFPNQISIPAPARGRTLVVTFQPSRSYFNSRPREGANFALYAGLSAVKLFQFPPPRGGELSAVCW